MSIGYVLKDYLNDIFVETGTQYGKTVSIAIKLGFKQIYSIEIDPVLGMACQDKFAKYNHVHICCGDSIDMLPKILEQINKKSTFLLDAHLLSAKNNGPKGKIICPIMKELDYILEHNKKYNLRHDILIDDRKFFNGKVDFFDYIKESTLINKIKSFDANYNIKKVGKSTNGLAAFIK